MAHFTHIPWVGPDGWSVLPDEIVGAIHASLLCCDVVGFHTNRWRSAFLATCSRLGLDVGDTLVTAHPISFDPAEFTALAASAPVLERERELLASRPETMILRVDRTDPSKNVSRGLQAFALLLERRPELHGHVGMLALLDPSRQEIPEYIDERRRIEEAAAAVEARFPGALRLRIADDFLQSIAAYKQFDVLLVNAVRDGLNLVAKEAPVVNERAGAVALSVNAGAFEELGDWVVAVEPLDISAPADALEDALALGEDERRSRQQAIRAHVGEHDLEEWIAAQLADLDRASSIRRR
jgi:trehalose 6-phosphate synthase